MCDSFLLFCFASVLQLLGRLRLTRLYPKHHLQQLGSIPSAGDTSAYTFQRHQQPEIDALRNDGPTSGAGRPRHSVHRLLPGRIHHQVHRLSNSADFFREQSERHRNSRRDSESYRPRPALRFFRPGQPSGVVPCLLFPHDVRGFPGGSPVQLRQALRGSAHPHGHDARERQRDFLSRLPDVRRCCGVRRGHLPLRDPVTPHHGGHAHRGLLGVQHHDDGRLR